MCFACAYWTRHNWAPVGHRGPWTSHRLVVERSARIIDAAIQAGVSRLVWTSIPVGPRYYIRPIHVDDYAAAVVGAVGSTGTFVRDATGPARVEFGELVEYLVSRTGGRACVLRLPIWTCAALYRLASSLMRDMRETILTTDELKGLSRNRLDSVEVPLGRIDLRAWLRDNVLTIGSRFLREPRR